MRFMLFVFAFLSLSACATLHPVPTSENGWQVKSTDLSGDSAESSARETARKHCSERGGKFEQLRVETGMEGFYTTKTLFYTCK